MSDWIACSERLPKCGDSPKYSDYFLVTGRNNGEEDSFVWFAAYCFMDQTWRDPEDAKVPNVRAWRALPFPYQA